MPSVVAIAVIPLIRSIGPKNVNSTKASFSRAAAIKTGTRMLGAYALKTISPPNARTRTPQWRTKNNDTLAGLWTPKVIRKKDGEEGGEGGRPQR